MVLKKKRNIEKVTIHKKYLKTVPLPEISDRCESHFLHLKPQGNTVQMSLLKFSNKLFSFFKKWWNIQADGKADNLTD